MKRILVRLAKIIGVAAAALLVFGIVGAMFGLGQDETTASDEGSSEAAVAANDPEPTAEAEPSETATKEPEPTADPEPTTEPEPEPAVVEPEPEPEPESEPDPHQLEESNLVDPERERGNETAFLTMIDTYRTSDDYPYMTEDSLTYAEGDKLLVVMGYEACDALAEADPQGDDEYEQVVTTYADEQGLSTGEAVAIFQSAEDQLCL